MLAIERQNAIMEELNDKKSITVSALSKQFKVTEETIRRDLGKLEQSDLLRRVHGGAYLVDGFVKEAPIRLRENIMLCEKQRIGSKCCEYIQQYDTIMLDSSTTALHIAKNLKLESKKVTVITNSLDAVKEFEDSEHIRVICIGGILRTLSHSFSGFDSLHMLGEYVADKAFVSAAGIHLQFGITDNIDSEARVRTAMLKNAGKKFFIADSTKFGKSSVHAVMPLGQIDYVVTELPPKPEWQKKFKDCGIELIVC